MEGHAGTVTFVSGLEPVAMALPFRRQVPVFFLPGYSLCRNLGAIVDMHELNAAGVFQIDGVVPVQTETMLAVEFNSLVTDYLGGLWALPIKQA